MASSQYIDLSPSEGAALIQRLQAQSPFASDWGLLIHLVRCYLWVIGAFREAKITIARLRRVFGIKTEKIKTPPKNNPPQSKETQDSQESAGAQTQPASSQTPKKRKGHGRIGHKLYSGAETIPVKHKSLKVGDPCPEKCGGKLYPAPPAVIIRITGSPLLRAARFLLEKLRCGLCGKVFCACLPEEVGIERYDERAKANVALQKYYLGAPFYRIEQFQKLLGVPLADATQWDLVEQVADCVNPVYEELTELAAQGEIIHNDDTVVKILSLIKENQENPDKKRKGMNTTGIVATSDNHRIVLFFSGRSHAGENLDKVLKERQESRGKIIQMADAKSASRTKETETVLCNCLVHARRKFVEIYDFFPQACEYVISALSKVYKTDALAREQGFTPEERLCLHQSESAPLMKELKSWLDKQIEQNEVEPKSALGQAINYMRNHWEELTRFLSVAGAPLDNNVCEQALKIPIRNRNNAMFFKTEHGALVGDILMSVIHTAALAQINPFDYLVALQCHRSALFRNPEKWLPWNYQATLEEISQARERPG